METITTVCRCCLVEGVHKNLNVTYCWFDQKEVYSEMLQECFNIVLATSSVEDSNAICDTCVKSLRDSLCFRKQVLHSEREFVKRLHQEGTDDKPFYIKQEPKTESDGIEDDDDDYMPETEAEIDAKPLAAMKNTEGKEQKRKKAKRVSPKASDDQWPSQKIKTLVTRLASTIDSRELPEGINKKDIKDMVKSTRKISIKKDPLYKDQAIKLLWKKRSIGDKKKHKENLQTILKYSNVTPFKNKSLLGFICGYCDSTFLDPADLRSHTEKDHQKERLNFKSNFDMTEYNVKLDVTDLSCTLCDEKMTDLNSFKVHIFKIHDKTFHNDIKDHMMQFKLRKGDVYDCAMCTSTYETFKMLKQHMNKHYNNYTCSKCDTAFATKRSLNAHRTTHQEGSFKCDLCEKVFATRSKKQYHEKTKHLGARNISNCPHCNVPFRSYYQRNQHLVKVHNSEAQYKCNVCNKAYILKSLLMYHIKKNHLMERNCQCTECGYRFFSKKALKAHMIKHSGERKYMCEVCHKSYARKYTLREHMRIHNNDRRFKCEVCGTAFVQKCSLKSHLLSHHGISMAACDITTS